MDPQPPPAHGSPQLLVRTTIYTFVTVATILVAALVALTLDLRARARREVAHSLEDARAVVSAMDERRLSDLKAQAAALARNPTFQAAIQKYRNEMGSFGPGEIRLSLDWLERQLQRAGEVLRADVVAALDTRDLTMARAGPAAREWPAAALSAQRPDGDGTSAQDHLVRTGAHVYRVVSVPLVVRGRMAGTLSMADRLDERYAAAVSELTRAETAVVADGRTVASTLPGTAAGEIAALGRPPAGERGTVTVLGESYAFRRLFNWNDTGIYTLAPLGRVVSSSTAGAFRALGLVAGGSLFLAGLGSLLLARRIASPIEAISRALASAAASQQTHLRLRPDGSSRELDTLVETFNDLMASVAASEAATQRTYLGAIESLAIALEARDPYTAGHSERVSDLSVRIGRRLGLAGEALEAVRLGALFHDIGKIGLDDAVLRKPGRLTTEEVEAIRQHPVLGSRILQPIGLLAAHLTIVEYHHERPDGRGYPHALAGEAIPLGARIVHVADAFDAMTSARPYRPALSQQDAVREIDACRGAQFDSAVVDAFFDVLRERDAEPVHGDCAPPLAQAG